MSTCKKNPKHLNPGTAGSSKNGAAGDKTEISRKSDKSVSISPIRIIDVKSDNLSGDKIIKNNVHKIGDKNHSVKSKNIGDRIGENIGDKMGENSGEEIGEISGDESDDQAAGDKNKHVENIDTDLDMKIETEDHSVYY